MKTLILALSLFCFTQFALAQDIRNPKKKSKLIFSYDKFRDITNVSTFPRKPKDTLGILVSGFFNYDGYMINKSVDKAGLVFDSYSSNWQFLKEEDRKLFVIADGERFEFKGTLHDATVNKSYPRPYGVYSRGVTVSERVIFPFDKEVLEKILAARSFEMKLGIYGKSFSLGNETLADLRELVTRMTPQP